MITSQLLWYYPNKTNKFISIVIIIFLLSLNTTCKHACNHTRLQNLIAKNWIDYWKNHVSATFLQISIGSGTMTEKGANTENICSCALSDVYKCIELHTYALQCCSVSYFCSTSFTLIYRNWFFAIQSN